MGSPGLNVLSQKEITDRIKNKSQIKKSKTQRFSDSEDEEGIFRDFTAKNESDRKGSEPFYASKDSPSDGSGSGDSVHLEEFKILKFISKGSFGSVFLAYLPRSATYFAIKCLQKDKLLT